MNRAVQINQMLGLGGGLWCLLPALLFLYWPDGPGVGFSAKYSSMLLLSTLVAGCDLSTRRIPNALCALIAVCGLAYSLLEGGVAGLLYSLLAGLIAFTLMAVFFFMGAVGGGDVKAIGALAMFIAPMDALIFFVVTTMAGGALAVVRMVMNMHAYKSIGIGQAESKTLTLPYGLAIWAGSLVMVIRAGGG